MRPKLYHLQPAHQLMGDLRGAFPQGEGRDELAVAVHGDEDPLAADRLRVH